jgi:putative MATE family efflux protein
VSLAFPFMMLMQHAANSGMGGGVSSAIARALGAGRRDRADALVCHAFILALALAALFSTTMLLGAPFVFRWMGGQGEVLSAALSYSNAVFSGAVSICVLNVLGNAVRGTGNMGLPSGVIVGSVIAHVLISPLLIFGWGALPALGPAGAGWGLMISFGAGSLVLLAYLRSPASLITLRFRGVSLQWGLFAEILKVGVPGLINVIITNLSVVLLTGIAGHLGREVAIGYAMGARLEYILIPLAFGIGAAIVPMVGTNWGAKQFTRARAIAWTGAVTVAMVCAAIGLIVAVFPALWMGLFSDDPEIIRYGTSYLRIVGPIYGLYGLGMAFYFATQGFGSVIWTVTANAVRLLASTGCALAAIYWLDLGAVGFFVAIAGGFCAYAALAAVAMVRVKQPVAALVLFALLAGSIALVSGTPAVAQPTCRPALAFKQVAFSAMTPTLERKWTAVLSVDASRCATTSGRFEIAFTRLKEYGIELDFREQFMWRPASVEVSVDFWADEAVGGYWLDNVAPCPCRK